MIFIPTKLESCFIIEPKIITDERGYFMESFNELTFQKGIGQNVHFFKITNLILLKVFCVDCIIKQVSMLKQNW